MNGRSALAAAPARAVPSMTAVRGTGLRDRTASPVVAIYEIDDEEAANWDAIVALRNRR